MKLWIDDVREAPIGYVWCKSTESAINTIIFNRNNIDLIDIDHDAGDFAKFGGDYIHVLDWLEYFGFCFPIRIHSMNPVGIRNMRAIIKRNNWEEIF